MKILSTYKKGISTSFVLGVLCVVAPHNLQAQHIDKDVFHLQDVVVTATRTPKTLKDVPAFTRIIRSNDIQKSGATNVLQILEYELPGIEFQMHQNERRVDVQGMKAGSVLFLVDGERVASGEQNNIDYYRFPADDIERIEIIKGAASALYGSNAIGAVINIITKKASKPFSFNVSGQYRSTKEMMGHIDVGGKYKHFDYRSSLSSQRLGGYKVNFKDGESLVLDTTTNISFNQKLGWTPNEKLKFGFNGDIYKSTRVNGDPRLGNHFYGYRGNLSAHWNISDNDNLMFSGLYDYFKKTVFNRKVDASRNDADDAQASLRGQYTHNFGEKNTLVVGTEWLREALFNASQVTDRKHSDNISLFAQHDVLLFNNLNLLYGLRLDKYSTFGANMAPKVSLMYKWKMLTLRASYAQGFTAPSLKELYMDFQHNGGGFYFHMKGNPDLKPERSNNFNASIQLVNTHFDLSVMAFYNKFRNKIIEKWSYQSGKATSQWVNAGNHTTVKGLEVMAKYRICQEWMLQANYTYSNIHNPLKMPNGEEANDVYTRPHILISTLNYSKSIKDWSFYASFRVKYGAKFYTPDYNRNLQQLHKTPQEAYTLLNLNGSVTYKKHITLSAQLENLTNYKPQTLSFNTPLVNGRSLMVGLRYSY